MTWFDDVAGRVATVFQQVFEVKPDQLTDETRRGDFERWDSLGHLALIEALREHFSIDIPPEQALDMESVGDTKRIVSTLLEAAADS